MDLKKYLIGVSACGIAVALIGFNLGYNSGLDKTEESKNTVEKVEYTGEASIMVAGIGNVIDNAKVDDDKLKAKTGKTNYLNAGIAASFENYSEYTEGLEEDEVKLSTEKLDVATNYIPKDSIIEGYTNLGVSNAHEYLNIRSGPSLDDSVIGKMPGYCACEIIEDLGEWYKIKSGDVEGYVYASLMVTGYDANVLAKENMEEKLYVTTDALNVREEPNTDCQINTLVSNGELLEILEDEKNGWYKININGLIGYVAAEFVERRNILPTAVEVQEVIATQPAAPAPEVNVTIDTSNLSDEVSQTAVDLINYAMQFLGNPYVAGGYSLTGGTDCSGFTKLIFEHFGYSLPRSSSDYLWAGTQVPLNRIKPGDLLLYMYGSSIGHVAIYIGNGQIVHASTPSTGIVIGNAYYTTPYCAVRIIP